MIPTKPSFGQAPLDCPLCPRLVAFREANRAKYPGFFNNPVPSFGSLEAEFLVVGLAPGLKGANQTGRPFTGDYAGKVLYEALALHGFGKGTYQERPDDEFTLVNCRITNAVRCVPPENKPTPEEAMTCRPFLEAEIAAMPKLKVILSLGLTSHAAVCKTLSIRQSQHPFGHGKWWDVSYKGRTVRLIDSYHSSRYNIQTNRLTQGMFNDIIKQVKAWL
ncbi:uracil-DNA glycosylase [bacterium]|nr:uracil-DNA glycosylase [bacterium]